MMALETRYEVSTQVDSSCPTERLPAMCGSATFAIEVSSTSMNVASVTVTAITQGLIDPSGILSFASNLCFISFVALYFSFCRSVDRLHRRVHVHTRPQ